MITQTYLNKELDLAARTFLYYMDYMISYLNVGSIKYNTWYLDAMQLDILSKTFLYIRIEDDLLYIGDTEISKAFFKVLSYKVREYYRSDIDSLYPAGSIISPTAIDTTPGPIIPPIYAAYLATWKEHTIVISEDTTTEIALPFTWENIDKESFSVTVEDGSPLKADSGAYYIENDILHWQHYYDLNIDDNVYMHYLQIKGL